MRFTYSGFSMAAVFIVHSCSDSLSLTDPYSINPVIHDEDQSGVPCWTQVTTKVSACATLFSSTSQSCPQQVSAYVFVGIRTISEVGFIECVHFLRSAFLGCDVYNILTWPQRLSEELKRTYCLIVDNMYKFVEDPAAVIWSLW